MYQQKLLTGVVLIDLTAAYHTVSKRGLLYKLIKSIKCRRLVDLIGNMLSDRLFQIEVDPNLNYDMQKKVFSQEKFQKALIKWIVMCDQPFTEPQQHTFSLLQIKQLELTS